MDKRLQAGIIVCLGIVIVALGVWQWSRGTLFGTGTSTQTFGSNVVFSGSTTFNSAPTFNSAMTAQAITATSLTATSTATSINASGTALFSTLTATNISATNVTSTNFLFSTTGTFAGNIGSAAMLARTSPTSTLKFVTGTQMEVVTATGTRFCYVPIGGGAFTSTDGACP